MAGWTDTSSFVLEVPLHYLCPSIVYSVPCDRIVQRAYSIKSNLLLGVLVFSFFSFVPICTKKPSNCNLVFRRIVIMLSILSVFVCFRFFYASFELLKETSAPTIESL